MTRLNIKKAAALASAAALMLSATACGENTTWGAEIDGNQIPAGVFIYYLQNAYYDAQSKLSEQTSAADEGTETASPELFASTIEEKSAKQWIYDEATRSMQEYAAVEAKFTEYGLILTDEEKQSAQIYCDQIWDYAGEYYTEMGISEKSYLSIYLNSEKKNKLFELLYSEGGEYAVSDSEIKTYLDENYAMINYISMELKDGSGNLLKSEGKAEIMTMAEDYVERYRNGEDLDVLNAEYTAYYDNLKAEAQAEAEAAAAEEAADSEVAEGLVTEVIPSDAEAPLAADGDELTEAEAAEETVTVSSDDENTAEVVEETAEEEAAAVTEAPETTMNPDDTIVTPDTKVADDAQEEDIVSSDGVFDSQEAELSSNKTVIEKTGTTPDTAVVSKVFDEMNKGDIQIIESTNGEYYYVVVKMDVLETDEYFNAARESLLYEMKSEEFDDVISQWTETQSVNKNQDAYDRYDPEKIFKTEG